jgi:stalled ribosome alternative rescue factor ArfA
MANVVVDNPQRKGTLQGGNKEAEVYKRPAELLVHDAIRQFRDELEKALKGKGTLEEQKTERLYYVEKIMRFVVQPALVEANNAIE